MHRQAFSCVFVVLSACGAPGPVPLAPEQVVEIHPGVGLVGLMDPSVGLPAPTCGAPLRIAAALPDSEARPDRAGEWLVLTNEGPDLVDLRDYRLVAGRRSGRLEGVVLEPGASAVLGAGGTSDLPVQLRNGRGEVRLVDPCGVVVSRLTWGGRRCARTRPGWIVVAPGHERDGPTRTMPGGAAEGGCGQT